MHVKVLLMLSPALLLLAACSARNGEPDGATGTMGRLILQIEDAEAAGDGRHCLLDVTARNDTGAAALNVQVAWMAQTEGFGIISEYQMLGDFAAGEMRSLRLGVSGAPCEAVRNVELTRAVCTVGPVQSPPQSCADLVILTGGGDVGSR